MCSLGPSLATPEIRGFPEFRSASSSLLMEVGHHCVSSEDLPTHGSTACGDSSPGAPDTPFCPLSAPCLPGRMSAWVPVEGEALGTSRPPHPTTKPAIHVGSPSSVHPSLPHAATAGPHARSHHHLCLPVGFWECRAHNRHPCPRFPWSLWMGSNPSPAPPCWDCLPKPLPSPRRQPRVSLFLVAVGLLAPVAQVKLSNKAPVGWIHTQATL